MNTLHFIQESPPTFYYLQLYYNDTAAPVARRAAEFGLSGEGYAWRHNIMDWQTASGLMDELYLQIDNSIPLSEVGLSTWGLPYLMSKGFEMDTLKQFAAEAGKMLKGSLDDLPRDLVRLKTIWHRLWVAASENEGISDSKTGAYRSCIRC